VIWTLLSLIGATLLVVRGTIFRRVREAAPSLLGCSQCFGFWVGAIAGGFGLLSFDHGRVLDTFAVGSTVSLLAMSSDIVLCKLAGGPAEE